MRNLSYIIKFLIITYVGFLHSYNYLFKESYAELNGDGQKDFIYTQMLKNGTMRLDARIGGKYYKKQINYQLWDIKPDEFDSVIVRNNERITYYYMGSYISYSLVSFIRPDRSVNRYVGIINVHWWSGAADGGEGNGIIVIYWDDKSQTFKNTHILVEGEIQQIFYPRWTIIYYKFLGWYSFLAHSEQPAIKICKVWDWNSMGFRIDYSRFLKDYLNMLKRLRFYLLKAKKLRNPQDIRRIKEDIKTLMNLINKSLQE